MATTGMDRVRQIVGAVAAVVLLAVSAALVIALAAALYSLGWDRQQIAPWPNRPAQPEVTGT